MMGLTRRSIAVRKIRRDQLGLAAQDVQPAIEWRAEQGRHFGEEFGRLRVVLPRVVICLGIPDFQGSKAIGPIELLQDSIAQLAGRPAAVGTIAHQVVLTFAGIAVHQKIDISHDKQRTVVYPDACGQGVACPGRVDLHFAFLDPYNLGERGQVLTGGPYPEAAEIRGTTTNRADLEDAHVVITNIGQLQGGAENRWLQALPADFFDLILFDEGHRSVAASYAMLKARFPAARIVNFSATPKRADGQIMAGRVVYSYPIFRAIQEGYVKRLKAIKQAICTRRIRL